MCILCLFGHLFFLLSCIGRVDNSAISIMPVGGMLKMAASSSAWTLTFHYTSSENGTSPIGNLPGL